MDKLNYLARNGAIILKFFLNVSKEEQRKRFLDRLEQPAKNWKFSLGDVAERALWDKYQAAYQDVMRHTSARHAPWHIVPADHKWFSRVVISSAIVSAMERLDLSFPEPEKGKTDELKKARDTLEKEGRETGVMPKKKKVDGAERRAAPEPLTQTFQSLIWRRRLAIALGCPPGQALHLE